MVHKINRNAKAPGLENDLKLREIREIKNIVKVTPLNILFKKLNVV